MTATDWRLMKLVSIKRFAVTEVLIVNLHMMKALQRARDDFSHDSTNKSVLFAFFLPANRGHLLHRELVDLEAIESLALFRQPDQHQQFVQPEVQLL